MLRKRQEIKSEKEKFLVETKDVKEMVGCRIPYGDKRVKHWKPLRENSKKNYWEFLFDSNYWT